MSKKLIEQLPYKVVHEDEYQMFVIFKDADSLACFLDEFGHRKRIINLKENIQVTFQKIQT